MLRFRFINLGLVLFSFLFVLSCFGGGGSPRSSSASGNADIGDEAGACGFSAVNESNACGQDENSPSDSNDPLISNLSFDLAGAIGLVVVDASPSSLSVVGQSVGSSNLMRVNSDQSLARAVKLGAVDVQSFMIANNQVYLLLKSAVNTCILVRVDGATNKTTCVDSSLSQIIWSNAYGDPIQFDGDGNIYYMGRTADGRTVLRENASGVKTDLINDNIALRGFLVLNDGRVFVSGMTSSTNTSWTRIINLAGSLESFLAFQSEFLSVFPDGNIYGSFGNSSNVFRYLTTTDELDSTFWVGDNDSYFSCPISSYLCRNPISLLRTTSDKIYGVLHPSDERILVQYYPSVFQVDTSVADITLSKGIMDYLLLAGFDSQNNNKLVLYNTDLDSEVDLLVGEEIEVYHLEYIRSGAQEIVMFDGLRFSDNRYVLCQVDLTNGNERTCSLTGMNKLTDFQLFEVQDTIAGGSATDIETYTVGGTVSGLYGTLVLQNNGQDEIELVKNGSFRFPIAVEDEYDVSIQAAPSGQACVISEGSGMVVDNHIDSISIACSVDDGVIVSVLGGNLLTLESGDNFYMPNIFDVAISPAGDLYFSDYRTIYKWLDGDRVSIIAGISSTGFSGDGGLATLAELDHPYGLTFDTAGNLYFADRENNRIRKIDTGGVIHTVAGSGLRGFFGDGGAATDAKLNYPSGLTIDSSGNLYIADRSNYRIRKVDTDGIITTVAGSGDSWYQEDGVQATVTGLATPYAIAVDPSGNLYMTTGSSRVRKVDTNGVITTVTGNGTQGFEGDGGLAANAQISISEDLALDSQGNLYIAGTYNHVIRRVGVDGTITTIAGVGATAFSGDGGLAVEAHLSSPAGVVVDTSGKIYIADRNNNRVRMIGSEE